MFIDANSSISVARSLLLAKHKSGHTGPEALAVDYKNADYNLFIV